MIKKIIFFLVLFFYIYPIFFGFLPIPNDRILQVLGVLVFIGTPTLRSKILVDGRLYRLLFLCSVVSFLALMAQTRNYTGLDTYYIKETLNIFFYFFSAYFVLWCYTWAFKDFSFIKLLDWVILVFIIQGIASFIFFFTPSLYESYLTLLNAETNQGLVDKIGYLNKRLMGIGSNFFSGVIKYGYALLIIAFLPFFRQSFFYNHKLVYSICLIILISAGIMTGRFFFIAILLTVLMYSTHGMSNIVRFIFKVVPLTLLGGWGVLLLADSFMDDNRLELVMNYVFELFINYSKNGELSTTSSDGTLSMYIFPDNINTWLFGDGKIQMNDGSYYMQTDVGYIRLLFYFGIISTIIHFMVQFFSYNLLKNLSSNSIIRRLIFFMFLWVILLNFKGLARGDEFLMLLFLGLLIEKHTKHGIV